MRPRDDEAGSIMVLALLVALVLVAVGLMAMWLSSSSTRVAANMTRRQEALYAAEQGIEHARSLLGRESIDWQRILVGPGVTEYPTVVGYCPELGTAHEMDVGGRGAIFCICTDPACGAGTKIILQNYAAASTTPGATMPAMAYTVYIRNDPMEWAGCDGDPTGETTNCPGHAASNEHWRRTTDADLRLLVRSEGTSRDGLSTAAVEAVLTLSGAKGQQPAYGQSGLTGQGNASAKVAITLPQ